MFMKLRELSSHGMRRFVFYPLPTGKNLHNISPHWADSPLQKFSKGLCGVASFARDRDSLAQRREAVVEGLRAGRVGDFAHGI
jgi:hypothetical protein